MTTTTTPKVTGSFYVRRHGKTTEDGFQTGRAGWTGPLRTRRQADREADAWRSCGWTVTVEPSTPEVRAEVRAWVQAVKSRSNAR